MPGRKVRKLPISGRDKTRMANGANPAVFLRSMPRTYDAFPPICRRDGINAYDCGGGLVLVATCIDGYANTLRKRAAMELPARGGRTAFLAWRTPSALRSLMNRLSKATRTLHSQAYSLRLLGYSPSEIRARCTALRRGKPNSAIG